MSSWVPAEYIAFDNHKIVHSIKNTPRQEGERGVKVLAVAPSSIGPALSLL